MNGQKCIDEEDHDYEFVGFMVVAEKLPEGPEKQVAGIPGTAVPYFPLPKYFPAKIEVHQCVKCGWITLRPAVFSRILSGDKKE